ncbi:rhodanese-like domain-containing protein [Entomomonas asaccharolytica]|uniref:Sulfurtransferase n=1 Tax=Entomomonas asaccharolytica TaxID=2785331 RepID=A0A974NDW6_9GAMM|nr:rhodanese-like domain-containing protein [Entomomonas asaccharolytica]QQP84587.1 sulfurtransferase [Entomomonas asaccharolytica]
MSEFSELPLVIEPNELLDRLSAPELILVDVGSELPYQQGHIAHAHCVETKQTQSQTGFYGLLPDKLSLEHLFGQLGHNSEATYVVYDDEGGGWAGRFIWLLDSIGHHNYHYLNGGLRAWIAEGYPLSTELPEVSVTSPKLTIDEEPTATFEYIQSRLGADDLVIWDARSLAEYNGEKLLAAKGGHIPGAVHLEWTAAMDTEHGLRIRSDIIDRLEELGITKDKEVITHCQSHHRSGFTYLVAKALGYPRVKAYAGAWSEWGNHPDTIVEN